MARKLRLVGVQVVPMFVWDDGETLAPGPQAQPQLVPAGELDGFPASLRAELEATNAKPDPHDHMKRGATPDDQPVNDS